MPDSLSRYSLEELERLLAEINCTIEQREQAAAADAQSAGADSSANGQTDAEARTAASTVAMTPVAASTATAPTSEAETPLQTVAETPVDPEAAPEPEPEPEPAPLVRYVHPASRNLSWSGEGPVPDWVTAYLAYGGSWSAMEYAAEQYLDGIAKRKALINWPPPRNRR